MEVSYHHASPADASPPPVVAARTTSMRIDGLDVGAYTIPTERPESDGTYEWDSTTIVVVQARAGDVSGLGYSYTQAGAAEVIRGKLASVVCGMDAQHPPAAWVAMVAAVRNFGAAGMVMMAVSAVDTALWDLHARLLGVPVSVALGGVHDAVPVYGSGGFCTYGPSEVAEQLLGWVEAGIPRVKMKVGRHPSHDADRLRAARTAIGDRVELYVDANGAFNRKQALEWAQRYAFDHGVRWFEEPVSSDDLAGLRLVRDRGPAGLDVAAGEYGSTPWYFERLLAAQAVDCLQADVTRCGGFTGFLKVGALCDAHGLDLSAHCAPQLAAHGCVGVWHLRHLEFFHDHNRIERRMFDGCLDPDDGVLRPDRSRPGLGLELRAADVEGWRVA